MRVLVTGANGFIGKNFLIFLKDKKDIDISTFNRGDSEEKLISLIDDADIIFHLAGANRPEDPDEFKLTNTGLTQKLISILSSHNKRVPIVYTSSTQALSDNLYGKSKKLAEESLEEFSLATKNPVCVFRLPNVFGKWCKPNYNSVVATFCHNIANDLPIKVNDPETSIKIVYVDDVVKSFLNVVDKGLSGFTWGKVNTEYTITLHDLSAKIYSFNNCRENLQIEKVGLGLTRALYSTYISYLPQNKFTYNLQSYEDPRGRFVEFLKTQDSGQFSFFSAPPGETRGCHYHHSKTEKFLIIQGKALFRFRNIITNEVYEVQTEGSKPTVVETIPGWAHNIKNVGEDEMIVMLWANEKFDKDNPDTYYCEV